jgi:hypothetical protein
MAASLTIARYMDALHGRAEQALYVYGTRANLPWPALRTASRAAGAIRRPFDTLRRRLMAASLAERAKAQGIEVSRTGGYGILNASAVPELGPAMEVARNIIRERSAGEIEKRPNNPFFMLLKKTDQPKYPALLEAAMSDGILGAAAGYLGVLPRLFSINVWLTRPNLSSEGLYNSQLWHLDKPDTGILSLFVNLNDVGEKNGPFTFLPADVSQRVRAATRYDRISILGDGRLDDEVTFKAARPSELVSLAGPAGTAGFVDTSTCLHQGSRCEEGERWTLVFRFVPAHTVRFSNHGVFNGHRWRSDPARQLALSGSAPA